MCGGDQRSGEEVLARERWSNNMLLYLHKDQSLHRLLRYTMHTVWYGNKGGRGSIGPAEHEFEHLQIQPSDWSEA